MTKIKNEGEKNNMIDMNNILDIAIEKDASDIHIVPGIKPTLRVKRELYTLDEFDIEIPDRAIKDFKTVGDVIAFIEKQ